MAQPAIGRIVHYKVGAGDVALIERVDLGVPRSTRNPVSEGDVYPAMVVRVFSTEGTANLQVFLDGDSSYWATSRREGDEPGCWAWPPQS